MEYSYDPWGNIEYHFNETIDTEEDAMLFTALCPLTYRGYNYDFTTGLYYLQSRYYNPEWGRFINCDDTNILLATQGETHNANLFAYCGNNPVNNTDPSGMLFEKAKQRKILRHYGFVLSLAIVVYAFYDQITIVADNHHKGAITIDLYTEKELDGEKASFSDLLLDLYEEFGNDVFDNNIFEGLAKISLGKFYDTFDTVYHEKYPDEWISKRKFLFSDECVEDEIKQHCLGYWQSQKKISFLHYSIRMNVGSKIFKADLEEHCKTIDIYEQDATMPRDAIAFQYYSRIRPTYRYTNADLYYYPQYKERFPTVNPDWLDKKIEK